MKSASKEFKKIIEQGGPFYAFAKVKLADGTQLELNSKDDFYVSGNTYSQTSSGNSFPLGEALCKTIDIGIDNHDDRYSNYDFYNAVITLYTEADLPDHTVERIQEGIFTVINPVSSGELIEFTAYDNMYKADKPFRPDGIHNSLLKLVQDICKQTGLKLSPISANFPHSDFNSSNYQKKADKVTARQLLGYIAQIAGGNALINETGELYFKLYDKVAIKNLSVVTGGQLFDNNTNYITGGNLTEDITDSISGGKLTENNVHILKDYATPPEISTDDVIITGVSTVVQTKDNKEETKLYGKEGYVLKIDNPLIWQAVDSCLKWIGDTVIGITLRPFSGSFFANPLIEFMDNVYVIDNKDNIYQSFVSSHTFTYLGESEISNTTPTPEKHDLVYSNNATSIYNAIKENVTNDRTEWEKAVENLNNDLSNASGLFSTKQVQPNGSTIYYLHDKKTLEESSVVIKLTSQAMGISTDGGKTYSVGITVDGEAIIKILQAVGINADWITTGTLTVGGLHNGKGKISVQDSQNKQIGTFNNKGITLESVPIQSVLRDVNGKIEASVEMNFGYLQLKDYSKDVYTVQISTEENDRIGIWEQLNGNTNYWTLVRQDPKSSLTNSPILYYNVTASGNKKANTMYNSCNWDFNGYSLTECTVDNSTVKNLTINSIKAVGKNKPVTGKIPIIHSISSTPDGRISWVSGEIVVNNGIIVGASIIN